jgi:maleate isomerase
MLAGHQLTCLAAPWRLLRAVTFPTRLGSGLLYGVIRIGVLTPHAAIGPEAEFPEMAPGQVAVSIALIQSRRGSHDPAAPAALAGLAVKPLVDDAADQLLREPVEVIGYASTTTGYVVGADAERDMMTSLAQRTGLSVATTCASAVSALHALQVRRVALIGAPWFTAELNDLGRAYFTCQGFDVVSSESARLSHDPAEIEPSAVAEWGTRHVSEAAEAVFFGGNGFRAAAAIAKLESAIARPVLTANQVLLWHLLADINAGFDVVGYGKLFACKP